MSEQQFPPGFDPENPPSEEELAAMAAEYEAQLKQVRVEDVILQTLVSLLNLGGRKAGLAPGTEDEQDPNQLGLAIEGGRRLLGLIEPALDPQDLAGIKDALSQLQMAFVQIGGQMAPGAEGAAPGEPGTPGEAAPPKPGEPGSATASGRLWVPGQ